MPTIPEVNGTYGEPTKITSTSSGSPQTLDTGPSSGEDRVWGYLSNTSSSAVTVSLLFGGSTDPDHKSVHVIPGYSGWVEVIPGFDLKGGGTVKGWATVANVVNYKSSKTRRTA